jgi:hypothetical protein
MPGTKNVYFPFKSQPNAEVEFLVLNRTMVNPVARKMSEIPLRENGE